MWAQCKAPIRTRVHVDQAPKIRTHTRSHSKYDHKCTTGRGSFPRPLLSMDDIAHRHRIASCHPPKFSSYNYMYKPPQQLLDAFSKLESSVILGIRRNTIYTAVSYSTLALFGLVRVPVCCTTGGGGSRSGLPKSPTTTTRLLPGHRSEIEFLHTSCGISTAPDMIFRSTTKHDLHVHSLILGPQ